MTLTERFEELYRLNRKHGETLETFPHNYLYRFDSAYLPLGRKASTLEQARESLKTYGPEGLLGTEICLLWLDGVR